MNYRIHKNLYRSVLIVFTGAATALYELTSTGAATALYELSYPQEPPLCELTSTRAATALYELSHPQELPLHSVNCHVHKSRHCTV